MTLKYAAVSPHHDPINDHILAAPRMPWVHHLRLGTMGFLLLSCTISTGRILPSVAARPTNATSADSRPTASRGSSRGIVGRGGRRVPGHGRWSVPGRVRGWKWKSTSMRAGNTFQSSGSGARRRFFPTVPLIHCATGVRGAPRRPPFNVYFQGTDSQHTGKEAKPPRPTARTSRNHIHKCPPQSPWTSTAMAIRLPAAS